LGQVVEGNELDNVGGPLTFTVSLEGPTPTPTSTPVPAPPEAGALSGSTWLYEGSEIAPQARVNVYWYHDDTLIAETVSDEQGNYLVPDLPSGTYTVVGEFTVDGVLYSDVAWDVVVTGGETTPYVTLYLH
jgi:hypothetical protein